MVSTNNTPADYSAMLTAGPVEAHVAASHRHYLSESKPAIHALVRVVDLHAEKFTAEELAALVIARRILDSKRVDCCLIKVAPEPAHLFL